MKHLFLVGLRTFLLIIGVCGTAAAFPYTLTDTTNFSTTTATSPDGSVDYIAHGGGAVDVLEGAGDFVKWQHQYSFDPPLGTITSAILELSLVDDEIDRFCVFNWATPYEVGFVYTESGQLAVGEVDTDTYGLNIDTSYLGDGKFAVLLGSLWGDFSIQYSRLTINYDSDGVSPAPVPEPASLLLMGIGLLGITTLSRKKLLIK
jgi:hypothetical protein